MSTTQNQEYKCAKCQHNQYETGQFRAAGGFWGKIFDVQNKRFNTLSCKNCGYTEIYKANSHAASNILDFFTNG